MMAEAGYLEPVPEEAERPPRPAGPPPTWVPAGGPAPLSQASSSGGYYEDYREGPEYRAQVEHTRYRRNAFAQRQAEAAAAAREAPEGTGKRIYDAAYKGGMAALRPLVQEWSGHDVLNWATNLYHHGTPLITSSYEGKLEAIKLLLDTPGEARCCPSLD